MIKECREFIDSLYPKKREWKDSEIVDVMVYYSEDGYTMKYLNDVVSIFRQNGEHVLNFENYEKFIEHICGNRKTE